jgi:hypothetical protein
MYQHGLFSASIKLPSDYTAGVVVAFYVSRPRSAYPIHLVICIHPHIVFTHIYTYM